MLYLLYLIPDHRLLLRDVRACQPHSLLLLAQPHILIHVCYQEPIELLGSPSLQVEGLSPRRLLLVVDVVLGFDVCSNGSELGGWSMSHVVDTDLS